MAKYGARIVDRLTNEQFLIPRGKELLSDASVQKRHLVNVSREFGLEEVPRWTPPAIRTLVKNKLLSAETATFNPDRLVSGPKVVTTHEMYATTNGERRVIRWHVFGEKHGFEKGCPKDNPRTVSIEKYLMEMAVLTTVFLFFFIEFFF